MKIKKILSITVVLLLAAIYIKTNIYMKPSLNDLKDEMEVLSQMNASQEIGKKQTIKLVKNYLKNNNTYIASNIEIDSEDSKYYIIHVYDVISNDGESHTATSGWYQVNKYTGEIIDIMQ